MKRTLQTLIKLAVTLLFLWLVYRRMESDQLWEQFNNISFLPLLLFFALLFVNTFISALKWQMILRADAVNVPVIYLFTSCLIGSFFNLFLPSTIGGDAYRIFSIKQHEAKLTKSFASVFSERLSGLLALAIFGLAFSVIGYKNLPHKLCFIVPLAVSLALLGVAVLAMSKPLAMKILDIIKVNKLTRVAQVLEKTLQSFEGYSRNPKLLFKIMGLSFLFQFLLIISIAILANALGIRIGLIYFFIFVPIITLLEMLPVSIYGFGLRDLGYVFFMGEMGMSNPQASAAAMSTLYVGMTLLYVSLGGLLFLIKVLFSNKRGQQICSKRIANE